MLGPVGAAGGPQAQALFRRTAANQLGDDTTAFGVAAVRQGRPTVVVEVGDGPAVGQPLTGERRALFRRAQPGRPPGWSRASSRKAGAACMRVQGSRAVVYRGTALRSALPVPSTERLALPWTAGRALRLADDGRSNLIVTNEDEPLTGSLQKAKVPVGADRWLLVVAERHPLAGTLAAQFPWFVLAGGLVPPGSSPRSWRPCSAGAPGR